jgi:hypothetical protein
MPRLRTIRAHERGTALIELALCLSLFWLPLFLGTVGIGFGLRLETQVTQVCRDVTLVLNKFEENGQKTSPPIIVRTSNCL